MDRSQLLGVMLRVVCVTGSFGAAAQTPLDCRPMDLSIVRIDPPPSPYSDFCGRETAACNLEGAVVLEWTADLQDLLTMVNRAVNAEVRFTPDIGNSGREESWDFPTGGFGDCEDYALEKRRRLIEEGLSSAALTCAIVLHRSRFFLHTVLLAETTAGTLVLDDRDDEVLCWDAVPYEFRLRERPDGFWSRFAPE